MLQNASGATAATSRCRSAFATSVDGDEEHGHRPVLAMPALHRRGPPSGPELAGHAGRHRDDGDPEHPGGESLPGDEAQEYAEPDASGVGADAERVLQIGDDLTDRRDLQDRAEGAQGHRTRRDFRARR